MAWRSGPLTQWPWHELGDLKYAILVPLAAHSMREFITESKSGSGELDMFNMVIIPTLLLRLLHGQLWISLSRFYAARRRRLIVDKGLDFDQVDRESNWDDVVFLGALISYIAKRLILGATNVPWWNTKGAILVMFSHVGPVEFVYYWFHRALHHHFLYARYHSHHHASIVTEPITGVIHPFIEMLAYHAIFSVPFAALVFTGTLSIGVFVGYLAFIDLMNYMGHCNFELVPRWLFRVFPPLKYLMYTPSYHSLHHTKFRTNYALFVPFYDYIFGTVDESSDNVYEKALREEAATPHVVHLSHLTTLQSIYHLPMGFKSLASAPYVPNKWSVRLMSPFTLVASMVLAKACESTFTSEKNKLEQLHLETWVIPRYSFGYMSSGDRDKINGMIEKAILEADKMGAEVVTLGLLNQSEELNAYGGLYLQKNPKLGTRIVDGTSLAVAVILNMIPRGTERVIYRGNVTKTGCELVSALCQRGIQVVTLDKDEYGSLNRRLPQEASSRLLLSSHGYHNEVWMVGEGLKDQEQGMAPKGTNFIPFSQFPPKTMRRDCIYRSTPAMVVPDAMENLHTCENWLPRKVMSAWRVAGIVHALQGWKNHECGDMVTGIDKAWNAALAHGFRPFQQSI